MKLTFDLIPVNSGLGSLLGRAFYGQAVGDYRALFKTVGAVAALELMPIARAIAVYVHPNSVRY
jgi:hypothetical protein